MRNWETERSSGPMRGQNSNGGGSEAADTEAERRLDTKLVPVSKLIYRTDYHMDVRGRQIKDEKNN